MKAFNLAALVLFSILSAGVCRASLGDTEARCITKYGAESDATDNLGDRIVGDRAVTFNISTPSGDLNLRVVFLHGTVAHEEISGAGGRSLPETQLKTLLDAESQGFKWEKGKTVFRTNNSGSTYGAQNWSRSDGAVAKFWVNAQAGSQDLSGQMEISTKLFAAAQAFYDRQNGVN
jgi:hypothetical protein